MRVKELTRQLAARLAAAEVATPALDARLLVGHALGLADGGAVLARRDQALSVAEVAASEALVTRRLAGEPVARILGRREFWSLPFRLSPAVLDPRPDSEVVVETTLALFVDTAPRTVVDLGTGSGCLLLALLHEWPGAKGHGVDRSAKALAVARTNAAALGLAARACFHQSDWLADCAVSITDDIDVLVANPPYIAADEIAGLAPEVRDHDPEAALNGGADGLDAYRVIAGQLAAPPWAARLADRPVVFEIGAAQAAAVTAIMAAVGFTRAALRHDYGGQARCLVFRRSR
ncbi:MAG: peptide chain release factor N(5)-glutamine methyltransferase [Thalassobaculaceae bacterium]